MTRLTWLLAAGVLHQRIYLDDIGAPVRQLPHAGWPGSVASKIKHGEAGQGLRGARDGHSEDSGQSRWKRDLLNRSDRSEIQQLIACRGARKGFLNERRFAFWERPPAAKCFFGCFLSSKQPW